MLKPKLNIRNFNNDFLLIRAEEEDASISAIGRQIFEQQFDFTDEVIVTEVELCLKLNQAFDPTKLKLLEGLESAPSANAKTYQLPVWFSEHEDWEAVITRTGFTKEKVIAQLLTTDFSLAMFGFLPGFAYFDGLNPALHIARKTIPAKYVKANSIAIGGKYLGLYAVDSPGGWHVIGQTPLSLLQIPKLPPVSWQLGDKIRLQSVSQVEYEQIRSKNLTLNQYNA